jgi:hypothetical protein
MTDQKAKQSADYPVGYGRPPKATQFPPGESGNPRGRPKGNRTIGAILQDVLGRKVDVTENGKTRRLPVVDVVIRRLINGAMRAEAPAVKLLFGLIAQYGQGANEGPSSRELSAEDQAILASYLLAHPERADDSAAKPDHEDRDAEKP